MEGFRILEITQPSELHLTSNQLTIEQQIVPKKNEKFLSLLKILNSSFARVSEMQALQKVS